MINVEKGYIFVHLRKTAGSTISAILKDEESAKEKHFGPADYVKKYGQNAWDDLFTFMIVRNPFDAIVSDFEFSRHLNEKLGSKIRKHRLSTEIGFSEWMRKFHKGIYATLRTPCGSFDFVDKTTLRIGDSVFAFNSVAKFENLSKDLEKIPCFSSDDVRKLSTVHRNKTNRPHYSKFYSKEDIKFIEYEFASFLDTYDYGFENGSNV